MNSFTARYRGKDCQFREALAISALFRLVFLAGALLIADSAPTKTKSEPDREVCVPTISADQAVYSISSKRSRADILVGKAGFLKPFGHRHVITARPSVGFLMVSANLHRSHACLDVQVESLEVDNADARTRYGLDHRLSDDDIQGTRRNMLDHVLLAEQWPVIHIRLNHLEGSLPSPMVLANLELLGHTESIEVQVTIHEQEFGLEISGSFELLQTDFGIDTFEAAAGGLRVKDEVMIEFRLIAERMRN